MSVIDEVKKTRLLEQLAKFWKDLSEEEKKEWRENAKNQ